MKQRVAEGIDGTPRAALSDLEMATMLHGGATLEEIGELAGITRERVRQRLKRIGVKPARRLDVMRLVDVLRERPVESMAQVGEAIRTETDKVERALYELGLIDAAVRLFRLRRRARIAANRESMLTSLRDYGKALGRTLRTQDIVSSERPKNVPSMTALQRAFGSLSKAFVAAGFTPSTRGRPPRAR